MTRYMCESVWKSVSKAINRVFDCSIDNIDSNNREISIKKAKNKTKLESQLKSCVFIVRLYLMLRFIHLIIEFPIYLLIFNRKLTAHTITESKAINSFCLFFNGFKRLF